MMWPKSSEKTMEHIRKVKWILNSGGSRIVWHVCTPPTPMQFLFPSDAGGATARTKRVRAPRRKSCFPHPS
ncbi:hypothetical protein PV326_000625 [Microctonus aethiopoides]|nr:hypothetical protein PV326_000625 [Microctonus aethiopoides]